MKSIMVIGVGGIGGLIAAPLVRTYGARVSLVQHGPRREAMLADGLTLHSDAYGDMTVHPEHVASKPSELPPCDLILVCVKNPALDDVISSLDGCVHEGTVIIPLMNGVRAYGRLQQAFPQASVLPAVIYVISYVQEDGSIIQKGNFNIVHIGSGEAKAADPQTGLSFWANTHHQLASDVTETP